MATIKPADADRFVAGGGKGYRLILVYGPDQGLVSERVAALLKTMVDDPADPFQFIRIDGDELASDPRRLIDEVNTVPLFGGRRAIRVTLGSRNIVAAMTPVLEHAADDCPIVIEAGDLKPSNPLRALLEKAPAAATLSCYEDDDNRLNLLIDEELRPRQLLLAPEARRVLLEALGANRAASRLELRKLADYAGTNQTISVEDVANIVGDVSRHETDTLVDAAFLADFATLERESGPQLRQANAGQAVLASALRHALLLHALAAAGGQSGAESILASARIFWKRRKAVEQQRRLWPLAKAEKATTLIHEAQLASRRNGAMAAAIVERCLWSIALASRR
jgi:DNA polymerase-3 subunit delta